jgi:hypothetical protein
LDSIEEYLEELQHGETNIRFGRLLTICKRTFGKPRTKGSHFIFKTPWPGKPWINLQETDSGEAKAYQVRQVKRALEKLKKQRSEH